METRCIQYESVQDDYTTMDWGQRMKEKMTPVHLLHDSFYCINYIYVSGFENRGHFALEYIYQYSPKNQVSKGIVNMVLLHHH